jgi:hypothetical protein
MAAPAVVLKLDPPSPKFPISEQCEMPKITVTAELQNFTPDPKAPPIQYQWKVTLIFNGQKCLHATQRIVKHDDITKFTTHPISKLNLQFTQVRGGALTISVKVPIPGGSILTDTTKNLVVTGTNPSVASLAAFATFIQANQAFRKLMRVESAGLKQFLSDTCPLFSEDNKCGVGLCQLTKDPIPTDDQFWSWKENVRGGWDLYKKKEKEARNHMKNVREGEFKALCKTYNEKRQAKLAAAAAAKPDAGAAAPIKDLEIELPDYTDEQLERDTIRGFNGYAGIHEYRVKVDKDGVLVVTEDASGAKGKAEWEQVTKAERIKFYDDHNVSANNRGDPNYVEDVESKAGF